MNNSKKTMMAALALTAAALAPAGAADILRGPSFGPAPAAAYVWSGPYVGANLGYQWGSQTNSGASPNGVMGGFQGGYNVQMNQFVIGAETDFQFSGANDRFGGWQFSNPWFGTLRARGGYAMNNILIYATLGMAYGGGRLDPGGGAVEHNTHVGWTAGAGIEVGLTPNWSAKAEYLYIDLSDQRYVTFGNTGFESSVFRLGVNYRF